jgi:hypothetical protein
VEDDDKEVSMGAGEDRNVHGYGGGVGLVQPHAKVPFTAQQQQDKHACAKLWGQCHAIFDFWFFS